jgi:hypothetical protein
MELLVQVLQFYQAEMLQLTVVLVGVEQVLVAQVLLLMAETVVQASS